MFIVLIDLMKKIRFTLTALPVNWLGQNAHIIVKSVIDAFLKWIIIVLGSAIVLDSLIISSLFYSAYMPPLTAFVWEY